MKKITVSILSVLMMLSMVFSSSVFAANEQPSAWESFIGLFGVKATETSDVGVEYRGHVENKGDFPVDGTWIQGPERLGTVGEGLRLEAFWIKLAEDAPAGLHIKYQVHVQNKGWMGFVEDGALAGTEGEALRIEAIQISLVDDEGNIADGYSVEYRGHVQNIGDTEWYADGAQLGTTGSGLRLEALEIKIVQLKADMTAYNAAVAAAAALTETDYTAESWAALQTALTDNVVTEDNTQAEVDAATAAINSAIDALQMVLQVSSVSAVNAKQVMVTYNTAVDTTTASTGTNYTITPVGGAAFNNALFTVELQDDQVSALITLGAGNALTTTATNYVVTVSTNVLDASGIALDEQFEGIFSMKDSTRPTSALSYTSNSTATVTFSEPMNVANAAAIQAVMTIKDADGTSVSPAGLVTLAADNMSFDLDISGFDLDENYTVSFIGLVDYAGNVITPNPTTYTVVRTNRDVTAPTVTSVVALDVNKIEITFSEKLGTLGTVNTEAIVVGGTATVDDSGLVYTVTTTGAATPALSGVTLVTIDGYADASGNAGATYTKTLNFVADTTAPTYVSSRVGQVGADSYLYVTYSEDVVLGAPVNALTGTYVDADSVTQPMTSIVVADASLDLAFGETTSDTIKIKITGLPSGTYTVATDAALVDDAAGNSAASTTMTFAFGSVVDPTVPVPVITSVQTTEDKVVVTFNVAVTAATALNTANYTVEGQQVFNSAIFSGDTKTVELTLKPDVITLGGDRVMEIKNVKTSAGNMMVDFSATKTFVENIKPVLTSAQISGATTIVATFSEAVTSADTAAFEYYIDGVLQSAVVNVAPAGATTVNITVPAITDLTKTYQIKYVGTDFVDGAATPNTAVSGTTVTAE
jgi:uncharacterized protein YjdB